MWLPGPTLKKERPILKITSLFMFPSPKRGLHQAPFFNSSFNSLFPSRWCMEPGLSETLSLLLPFTAGPWLLMTPSWTYSPTHLTPLLGPHLMQGERQWELEVGMCQVSQDLPPSQSWWHVSQCHHGCPRSLQWRAPVNMSFLCCQINATRFLIIGILLD